jgi:glycosyltransferase involved in cell wall biosynthesis
MTPTLSIVVPVYNEATFIPQALPMLISEMDGLGLPYQIHLVENGSNDGSADVAREVAGDAPVMVSSLAIADYGSAMRHGFLEAEGDWVVNFDIDYFSADFLKQVIAIPEADLVIGSKRNPSSEDNRPLIRRLATWVFNLLLRTILGSKVSDTHGMKAFRRGLVDDLAGVVVSRQDLYDTELVIRAERSGYRIVEVPVVVEEIRSARSSLVKRVPRTLVGLVRIRRVLQSESSTQHSSA